MDSSYEPFVKLAPIVLGVFAALKIVIDLMLGRYTHRRDEYRFAREFFRDLNADPNMHPFLKEKGYQALAGDNSLSADEVSYLLTLKGSARALNDYVLARPYLEYLATGTGAQIKFRKKYEKVNSRRWRQSLYFGLYLLFYFLGFSPLVARAFHLITFWQALPLLAATALVFFPFAFFSIKEGVRIARAEKLEKEQTKDAREAMRLLIGSCKV